MNGTAERKQPGAPRRRWIQRRRYLIDWRFQLRLALLPLGLATVLLVLLNAALLVARRAETRGLVGNGPGVATHLAAVDRSEATFTLLVSLLLLVGIGAMLTLYTHRTAGAAFSLERTLRCLARQELTSRPRLRRGDYLAGLGRAVRELAEALEARAADELHVLQAIALRLDASPGDPEAQRELRRLVEAKRHALGRPVPEDEDPGPLSPRTACPERSAESAAHPVRS